MDPAWHPFTHHQLSSAQDLARRLGLPLAHAPLLCRHALFEDAAAGDFLDPRLKTLRDPFLLPDMEAAGRRILQAVDRGEKVALYGDYDVDGVTSLAMLRRMLAAYGNVAGCFLPHRVEEGYGLSREGLERCLAEHRPSLLIAVDCGTSSAAEIAGLRRENIDVIVLDHHECSSGWPDCVAVVNPKRGTDSRDLCSGGVVFKMCHALLKMRPLPGFDLKDFLDLTALATVADIVPLIGENRLFVRHGLARMPETKWIGLRVLMEVAGVSAPVSASDVGFRLGRDSMPRGASGRRKRRWICFRRMIRCVRGSSPPSFTSKMRSARQSRK